MTFNKSKHTRHLGYFFKVTLAAVIMLLSLSLGEGGKTIAQEKSKYEKLNERKNKSNRRKRLRGDRARSNKQKIRASKFKSRTRQGEKAYKGDITGRKVVTKSTRRRSNASYAQPNPYAGRKRKTEASVAKRALSSPRSTARSSESASRARIVKPRTATRSGERAWSGSGIKRALKTQSVRTTFTKNRRYQGGAVRSASRPSERSVKRTRVVPRSATGNYTVRKKRSPYNALRKQKSWERAYKGDITGRTFRSKQTNDRPGIKKPPRIKYTNSGKRGDRPYSGGIGGNYKSLGRNAERAWKNDISGKKLRIRTSKGANFAGNQFKPLPRSKRKGDTAFKGKLKGSGYKSISSGKEVAGKKGQRSAPPGSGTSRGLSFQGNIKSGKPLKGGGSISGRTWNNKGQSTTQKLNTDQSQRTRAFQGNLKFKKPAKGGGSLARKDWNNKGRAVTKLSNNEQNRRTRTFQGNIKTSKPIKGGGSVSRNNWNNKGQSTNRKINSEQNNRVRSFQGNIKTGKPLKGGGSVARSNWNNKGKSVNRPVQSTEGQKATNFTGNMKPLVGGRYDALSSIYKGNQKRKQGYTKNPSSARLALKAKNIKNRSDLSEYKGDRKPFKGGKYDALAGFYKGNQKRKQGYIKNPSSARLALKAKNIKNKSDLSEYKGDRKPFIRGKYDALAGFYKGDVKRKFDYRKNPYSAKEALKVKQALKSDRQSAAYLGNIKGRRKFKHNPASAEEALKRRYPKKNYFQAGDFSGRTKDNRKYKQNPSSADESLINILPGAGTAKGRDFQGRTKVTWSYRQNPNSAKGALKGIGPSKAAVKASSYQGNIKMSRKRPEDIHPSYRYAKNKNSATQEKEKLFSFKLMFAKWFKKSESQPKNLKEKERRPRFDNKEKDIWYD